MSETVRTQIELPRDMFNLLKERGEAYGITPAEQIVEALDAYLQGNADNMLQADDPILSIDGNVASDRGDLSANHDRYLYHQRDRQET